MTERRWSGPYCAAATADGVRLAWNPLTDHRPPHGAVKFVVRWRVDPFDNPRKRTFTDASQASVWARQVEAARLLHLPCDDSGGPLNTKPTSAPTGRDRMGGSGSVQAENRTPTTLPAGTSAAPARAADAAAAWTATDGERTGADLAALALRRCPAASATIVDGYGPAGMLVVLGRTVADYIDELVRLNRPVWEQQGQHGRGVVWWLGQLEFVKAVLCYRVDDERIRTHGVEAGGSVHFALLTHGDLNHALAQRRAVNLRVEHQNLQRQGKYDRDLVKYEQKLAAWQARTGHKGRKPVPPAPALQRCSVSTDGSVLVGTHAEKAFRTALSFAFDRAFDEGLLPPGPNLYRKWNPRGTGGFRSTRSSPFRRVAKPTAEARDYPGLGYWVDLGDALAERGTSLGDGLRAGERYRVLPLVLVQLATRPGEGRRLHADQLRSGEALVAPEPGGISRGARLVRPGQSR